MAKKPNRRNAHRYAPENDRCMLGWSDSGPFRSLPARLLNLSVSGALLAVDGEWSLPEPGRVMIRLGGDDHERWTRAELLQVACPEEGPRQVRVRLLEPVPYEVFKFTVWGDNPKNSRASPTPTAATEPPGRVVWDQEDEAIPDIPAAAGRDEYDDEVEETPAGPPSMRHPPQIPGTLSVARSLRAEFPGLVDAHRKNRSSMDRVQPVPWLTIAVFSSLTIVLLVIAVTRQYSHAHHLGDMLGLLH